MAVREIAVNDRDSEHDVAVDHVRLLGHRLHTHEPWLDGAVLRTTVATVGIAIVAFFAQEQAVAARGGAGRSRTVGFGAAIGGAPVVGEGVTVVAALGPFFDAVTTCRWHARHAVDLALVVVLDLAELVAAVASYGVAVVAPFRRCPDAVPADGQQATRLPGWIARVALLDLQAVRRASVAADRIAVVARFVGSQLGIAAVGWSLLARVAHAIRIGTSGVDLNAGRGHCLTIGAATGTADTRGTPRARSLATAWCSGRAGEDNAGSNDERRKG